MARQSINNSPKMYIRRACRRELRDQADAQLEPMGLQSKFRRLMNLYKPSRLDDRVTALSSEAAAEAAALRDELAALRAKHTELELKLELKVASLARREEVDLFKSSLEVPFEWIAEFQEWKARHPIPEQPLVTVCVATFNRGRLLTERCIPSILGQTYRNLELIVVGDGCT